MKLRDLLRVAKAIDGKTERTASRDIFAELSREDEQVQELAADVFNALCSMLISNDKITYLLTKTIDLATHTLRGAMRTTAKLAMRTVFPQRSKAAREAIKFRHISERLANAA